MSKKKPPASLIDAFRAIEAVEQLGVLIAEDGFDQETLHVLSSFLHCEHTWREPSRKCPDNGRPTAAAYAWLMSGLTLDYVAIAEAAGVSRQAASARMAMLIGNRLVYPDGQIHKLARAALQGAIAKRARAGQRKGKDKDKDENKAAAN